MQTLTFIAALAYDVLCIRDLNGNSVREHFPKTGVNNSKPVHNICFGRSSGTSRLTMAPAHFGNELERCESP